MAVIFNGFVLSGCNIFGAVGNVDGSEGNWVKSPLGLVGKRLGLILTEFINDSCDAFLIASRNEGRLVGFTESSCVVANGKAGIVLISKFGVLLNPADWLTPKVSGGNFFSVIIFSY